MRLVYVRRFSLTRKEEEEKIGRGPPTLAGRIGVKDRELKNSRRCKKCLLYNLLAGYQLGGQMIKKWVRVVHVVWHARHESRVRFMWPLVSASVAGGVVFYRFSY